VPATAESAVASNADLMLPYRPASATATKYIANGRRPPTAGVRLQRMSVAAATAARASR
jgi:hypothetical protein